MPYKDKEKQKESQRQSYIRKRGEFFAGKRCAVWWCGSQDNLELDHIDPSTKIHHAVWTWSKERRESELQKCQVLCRLCHQKKTGEQHRQTMHGTHGMYERHKCRCIDCKAWKAKKNALRFL